MTKIPKLFRSRIMIPFIYVQKQTMPTVLAALLSAANVSIRHQNLGGVPRDARKQSKTYQILTNTTTVAMACMISKMKQILGGATRMLKRMVSLLITGLFE